MNKSYKEVVVEETIKVMEESGWGFAEAVTALLEWVYDCGYNECMRNIKEKTFSQYTDIISNGGMDPRN